MALLTKITTLSLAVRPSQHLTHLSRPDMSLVQRERALSLNPLPSLSLRAVSWDRTTPRSHSLLLRVVNHCCGRSAMRRCQHTAAESGSSEVKYVTIWNNKNHTHGTQTGRATNSPPGREEVWGRSARNRRDLLDVSLLLARPQIGLHSPWRQSKGKKLSGLSICFVCGLRGPSLIF